MKKTKSLLALIFFIAVLSYGCKKQETYDPAQQLVTDEAIINAYLSANSLVALRHSTGVYYQIITPGTGSFPYNINTQVNVKYTGRLLSGQVFDQNPTGVLFTLGNLIYGWQIGIPLIQKGGKIRLFVPSGYAYGPQARSGIPANSVLDFEIEVLDIYQ